MIIDGLIIGGALVFAALAGGGVWLLLRWLEARGEDASYGVTVHAADVEGLGYGEMPPEIAHEWDGQLPNRGDAQGRDVRVRADDSRPAARADLTGSLSPRPPWERPGAASAPPHPGTTPTSPACPPPAAAAQREPEPGTAAAAGVDATPPASVPPPLPQAALAAAEPWKVPFTAWESDTFVGALLAIRDHDTDAPLSAPAEVHAELRAEGLEA